MAFSQIREVFKENKKSSAWDLYKLLIVFESLRRTHIDIY